MSEIRIIPSAPVAPGRRVLEGRTRAPVHVVACAEPRDEALHAHAELAARRLEEQATKHEAQMRDALEAARADHDSRRDHEVREELARTRAGAREEGRLEGLADGLDEIRRGERERLERLDAILGALELAHRQWRGELEEAAVDIGFAVACRILGDALATPEGVRAHVRAVIREASDSEGAVVRVHPHDAARLRSLGDFAAMVVARATLVVDPDVAIGSCRVDTAAGTLESRLDERMAALRDALLAAHTMKEPAP